MMNEWILHFDGLCEPNPGGIICWAYVIRGPGEPIIASNSLSQTSGATNNIAEWTALGLSLRHIADGEDRPDKLLVFGDSQLVIYQLTGKWQCKKESMAKLRDRCLDLLKQIGVPWEARWVPRHENLEADTLSRKAYLATTGKEAPDRSRK